MKNKEKLLNNNNDTLIYKNNNNIRFKRMNRRLKGGWLVFALSTLSMVSVGFSMWTISGAGSGDYNIGLDADDLFDATSLFSIHKPEMFSYCEYGIVRDETIVSDGYIYFPITIQTGNENFDRIKNSETGDVSFIVSVTNKSVLDIFNSSFLSQTDGKIATSYSLSSTGFSTDCNLSTESTILDKTISTQIIIASNNELLSQSSVSLNIAYHFIFSDFKKDAYGLLVENGLSFSVKLGVELL